MSTSNRFAFFAWAVLVINIIVILWGAVVRATGSGAGCGAHWPVCNGQIIPIAPTAQTLIEYSHRASSGVALLAVFVLAGWAFRAYPNGHAVRRGAVASTVFIILEALIGAFIVWFRLVADNPSVERALSTSLHLVNTLLLLAALTLTAWWAAGGEALQLRGQSRLRLAGFGLALAGVMAIGASGAVIALGDTLFPAQSLDHGLAQDLDRNAHFAVQLRWVHPMIAILVGAFIMAFASRLMVVTSTAKRFAQITMGLVLVQWAAGGLNVVLLAPVWMQIVHLLIADGLWITLVLLAASVLRPVVGPVTAQTPLSTITKVS